MNPETFTLNLNIEQINTVLNALSEIQYKISAPLIDEIRKQTISQISSKEKIEAGVVSDIR